MHLYRIKSINLNRFLVLADDHCDAAKIVSRAIMTGMNHRPDAEFDVVQVEVDQMRPAPPAEWLAKCPKGILWSIDDGAGWELIEATAKPGAS